MTALPWQAEQRKLIERLRVAGRVPHAMLMSGPRHIGKRLFSTSIAQLLLCREPKDGVACDQCDDCHYFRAGTHPDYRLVAPEDSKLIRVDQIRELIEWAGQTAQRSGRRVVQVVPAEQMNLNAANALLKCLEEPGEATVFLLVSDMPGRLLPTIRSRCRHVDLPVPYHEVSLDWLSKCLPDHSREELAQLLSISGGAPLAVTEVLSEEFLVRRKEIAAAIGALLRGDNPLQVARPFTRGDPDADLWICYSLFADALRLAMSGDLVNVRNRDLDEVVELAAKTMPVDGLVKSVDAIARDRRAAASSGNPNLAMLFESLMIELAGYCNL